MQQVGLDLGFRWLLYWSIRDSHGSWRDIDRTSVLFIAVSFGDGPPLGFLVSWCRMLRKLDSSKAVVGVRRTCSSETSCRLLVLQDVSPIDLARFLEDDVKPSIHV